MRNFNVTGLCVPDMHYMVDISHKTAEIKKLIDQGLYFTINRGRQKGKTTLMAAIEAAFSEEYFIISISFEGVNDIFSSVDRFCSSFFKLLSNSYSLTDPALADKIKQYGCDIDEYDDLSNAITKFCQDTEMETGKEVVLMIDEVDKASNYYVFMDFLGMLRTKYLNRNKGKDKSFRSVILAGVNDIKRLKAHINDRRLLSDEEARNLQHSEFNSPWNIAADFEVEMDFLPSEIETLFDDYLSENHDVEIDKTRVSELIYKHTSGYPFLVSKICKIIVEKLSGNWEDNGIEKAINILLNESNTLFDDLIKNIDNVPDLNSLVVDLLLKNEEITFNPQAHSIGTMYSILKDQNGKLKVHNKIFETLIFNYFIACRKKDEISAYTASGAYVNQDGSLDMETALLKFQEYFKSVYAAIDTEFLERQGRLLLLAFFKPIINGTGFYFIEPHTGMEKRQDVVITMNGYKYIIELKIWRGEKYHQSGLKQLAEYLEMENLEKGYLVCFNFNKNKEYNHKTETSNGKEIFTVMV